MSKPNTTEVHGEIGGAVFATTHWSVVLAARDQDSPQSAQALESLCRDYWYPLYSYVRRSGHGPQDAEDLTQEFFTRLIGKNYLKVVMPEKGRFRTFLIVALKRFLANEWDRVRALKRGGDRKMISLDFADAEQRFQVEPNPMVQCETNFDKQWAIILLERALSCLEKAYQKEDKEIEFAQLRGFLTMGQENISYAALAQLLGSSEANARMTVHRIRKRFREIFRDMVAQTLADTSDVEDEMHALLAALAQ